MNGVAKFEITKDEVALYVRRLREEALRLKQPLTNGAVMVAISRAVGREASPPEKALADMVESIGLVSQNLLEMAARLEETADAGVL
ncbi:MAG: hypothetical protein AAGJ95_09480 [Cyanobacteria bacterium J06554_11]